MKIKYVFLLITLIFSGCGMNITSDPVKFEDVNVKHSVYLNPQALRDYFEITCREQYTSDPEIQDCIDKGISEFMKVFARVTNPNYTPEPTPSSTPTP